VPLGVPPQASAVFTGKMLPTNPKAAAVKQTAVVFFMPPNMTNSPYEKL
jgi:hypothetical protein